MAESITLPPIQLLLIYHRAATAMVRRVRASIRRDVYTGLWDLKYHGIEYKGVTNERVAAALESVSPLLPGHTYYVKESFAIRGNFIRYRVDYPLSRLAADSSKWRKPSEMEEFMARCRLTILNVRACQADQLSAREIVEQMKFTNPFRFISFMQSDTTGLDWFKSWRNFNPHQWIYYVQFKVDLLYGTPGSYYRRGKKEEAGGPGLGAAEPDSES